MGSATVELVNVEIWVVVDGSGNYVCSCDPGALTDEYEKEVGALDGQTPTRVLKLSVSVPKPQPVELVASVPEEPAVGELKVA